MLNGDETELQIFESFRIDRDLPKHSKKEEKRSRQKGINFSGDFEEGGVEMMEAWGPPRIGLRRVGGNWLTRWWANRKERPTISIEDFFTSIKNTTEEVKIVQERAQGYQRALEEARQNGQKALCEKLEAGLFAFKAESQMVAIGITKYVTARTVIEFYKKSPKGLRLDYIRNFTRRIPQELSQLKKRADDLEIFDNYVVLHYDPKAKSYAETEKEKQARIARERDPILFGLLKGRTDLYVLGDWIDEFCDLTLDQMAEVLGAPAIQDIKGAGET